MLYLKRKVGESVIINDNIRVTVTEISGKSAKLEFDFPDDVSVLRKELYDKIQLQNLEAANMHDHIVTIADRLEDIPKHKLKD